MSDDPATQNAATTDLMRRFNEAFLRHDPDLLDGLIAEDCVLENTTPAPNGSRHVGRAACLALWRGIASNRDGSFEPEDIIAIGDRAIIQWRYRWGEGDENSVRGVNLMRVRDGSIVEGLGSVKGV
jgi:ketosteroid isomerase-like protein